MITALVLTPVTQDSDKESKGIEISVTILASQTNSFIGMVTAPMNVPSLLSKRKSEPNISATSLAQRLNIFTTTVNARMNAQNLTFSLMSEAISTAILHAQPLNI